MSMKSPWFLLGISLICLVGGWMVPVLKGREEVSIVIFAIPFLLSACFPLVRQSVKDWGAKRAGYVWLALSLFAYLIESIGTQTGFPYGQFEYLSGTGPLLFGVPVWLPLAWAPLLLGAWQVSVRITASKAGRILLSASLLVLLDLVLDPGAVALGIWRYDAIRSGTSPQYFFVPWSNFAGWLVSGSLGAWLLSRFSLPSSPKLAYWLLPMVAGLSFWTGVVAREGYGFPTILGLLLLLALLALVGRDE